MGGIRNIRPFLPSNTRGGITVDFLHVPIPTPLRPTSFSSLLVLLVYDYKISDLEVWIVEQFIEIFGVPHTNIHCPSVTLWTMKFTWGDALRACTNASWLYMVVLETLQLPLQKKHYNCVVFRPPQTPLASSAIGSTYWAFSAVRYCSNPT